MSCWFIPIVSFMPTSIRFVTPIEHHRGMDQQAGMRCISRPVPATQDAGQERHATGSPLERSCSIRIGNNRSRKKWHKNTVDTITTLKNAASLLEGQGWHYRRRLLRACHMGGIMQQANEEQETIVSFSRQATLDERLPKGMAQYRSIGAIYNDV
ncbi:hypothetical protein VO68_20140 [Aeromonas salmonicida]|nr:hypothetical protein VO68_20140 [Aeromonas salmonicida]